jgi:hypothetical protein
MKISANKKRIPILAICSLLLCTLLFLALINIKDNSDINSQYRYFFYICLFVWSLYYTIISSIDYLRSIFNSKAVFLVTEKGLSDHLSIFSCGRIDWDEISDLQINTIWGIKFLVVKLIQPEAVINCQSKWKQRTLRTFKKRFGSPVVISQKRVQYDLEQLKDELSGYLKGK